MKYLFLLIPFLGNAQFMTKYTLTMEPKVVEEALQLKSGDLEEMVTIINFTSTTLEVSNSRMSVTIYPDRTFGKLLTTGRTGAGELVLVQLIYMKSVPGKKMTVLRLSYDKEYLFFPEKPWK